MDECFNAAQKIVADGLVSGLTIAIYENENWTRATFGKVSYGGPDLMDSHRFDIASLTKLFTTTRILQLCEEGKITLDTPIQAIIPHFRNANMTIQHCLLHRSGLAPSVTGRYDMNQNEIYQSVITCFDLVRNPNESMVYSCINFLILGYVIEAIDQSLDLSFEQAIFKPLQMKHTSFNPENRHICVPSEFTEKHGLIQGIVHDETARNCGGIAGNAGLFATRSDIEKFAEAMVTHNPSLLRTETYQQIQQTDIDSRSLGWNRYVYKDTNACFHTGFTGPLLVLDQKRALILLAHRVHPSRTDTGYLSRREALMQTFLNKKKK